MLINSSGLLFSNEENSFINIENQRSFVEKNISSVKEIINLKDLDSL